MQPGTLSEEMPWVYIFAPAVVSGEALGDPATGAWEE